MFRLPMTCLRVVTITVSFFSAFAWIAASCMAGPIQLSAFSGNETVVTMNEIPRTNINIEVPSSAWLSSRLVRGIYLRGAHDIGLPGSLNAYDSPFGLSPTAGDANGFLNASQGVALQVEIPGGYGLQMDFRSLEETPKRVGFLSSFSDTYYGGPGATIITNPNVRLSVAVNRGDSTSQYYSYEAGRQLIAFEEAAGISTVELTVTGLPYSYYGIYSPSVTLDDIRFEVVPEPSTSVMALLGIGFTGYSVWRRKRSLTSGGRRPSTSRA
jgi:hypothetical protein